MGGQGESYIHPGWADKVNPIYPPQKVACRDIKKSTMVKNMSR